MSLVFAFVASFVTSGSVAGSGVGSRVGIWSTFFIGNNLFLKVLRTFSLVLNNSAKLFKKYFFLKSFYTFIKIL